MTEQPAGELGRRAARGMAASTISNGANRGLLLVATMIVARIFSPEEFGAATAALAVASFLQLALDAGVSQAVIVGSDEDTHERAATGATINLAITIALSLGVFLAAPALADVFGVPNEAGLFQLVALFLLLRGAGKVQNALLERRLEFGTRSRIEVGRGVVRFVVTVVLAVNGSGAVAIVWGLVAGEAFGLILLLVAVPVRFNLHFERRVVGPMLRFGGGITASRFAGELASNADYLVVGARIGPTALGYYGVAYRLPELLISNVFWVASSVLFPVFARAATHDISDLRQALLKALRLCTLFGMALGVGLALTARDSIAVLFGSTWAPAATPMVLISLALGLHGIAYPVGDVLKAMGRIGLFTVIEIGLAVVAVAAFLAAATHGINAVAGVHLGLAALSVGVFLVVARIVCRVHLTELVAALVPGAVVTVGILVGGLPVRLALPTGLGALVTIIVAGTLGGLLFLRLFARSSLRDAVGFVRMMRA